MTRRLYLTDSCLSRFEARVVERLTWDDRPAVVLDQTAFYPESGGQPADRGYIEAAAVLDVVEREGDKAVVHVVSQPLPNGRVEGRLDWERRFDHMQQHTGQHILSAAFDSQLDARTVGFHLGSSSSTIDVDAAGLTTEQVHAVEIRANHIVWSDLTITARLRDPDSPAALKGNVPADIDGPLRLVTISDDIEDATSPVDVNPCGGTHVARTGEVGMIKVVDLERRAVRTRITFLCGQRALRDYHHKNGILTALSNRLTVGYWELDAAVQRLSAENRELRRTEHQMRDQLVGLEADQLLHTADRRGRYRVVSRLWTDRTPASLGALARRLADQPETVAILFSLDDRTHFCFARSQGLDVDVDHLLQQTCGALDGRGGGRPEVAQGSAPAASPSEIESVLNNLLSTLEQL